MSDRDSSANYGQGVESFRTPTVIAVVVTYNRKELLVRCLAALANQSRPPDRILVVDNAGTDGSADAVRREFPQVELLELPENVGGAGGFHRGIEWGHSYGYEWFWLMDDDTLAEAEALETLLRAAERAAKQSPLVLASKVLWKDGSLHPMNLPLPLRHRRNKCKAEVGGSLVPIRYATFVSLLLRREAVDRFGLPLAHYFIWSDDLEYTSRILREEHGYLVPESRVFHWTSEPHSVFTVRGTTFYYHVRNSLFLLRGTSLSPLEKPGHFKFWAYTICSYLVRRRFSRDAFDVVLRGVRDGLRGETR